ncbi:hypothetical protein DFR26_0427 [Paraperlucidibaca baekdonensis]|uniref:Uncharacterized protein n=1 Tax=Paraperlucidibaca baekdonensis TaxID=748120 RepID=A0A3E0H948_9GAMM|nr:putative DNA-binding domain-containing protein [Paraperlucidibaca baekdonensis]REH40228.1 hypothetical protein DFR26_0427 [Paraperlucidibaca baekdonensis]
MPPESLRANPESSTAADSALPEFQRQQLAFTAHLRDPSAVAAPTGIKPERLATYRELLFNNVINFVDITFPVAKAQLGEALWGRLTQRFFADFSCTSPFFYDISLHFREFVGALDWPELTALPWLESLLHYEWMELVADIDESPMAEAFDASAVLAMLNASDPKLSLAGPAWALAYQWRVHEWREHTDLSAVTAAPVCLMAIRADDAALSLKVHEITPLAAFLLEQLSEAEAPVRRSALIAAVCAAMPQAEAAEIREMTTAVLRDLIAHGLRLQAR